MEESRYSKEELKESEKFGNKTDLIEALFENDKEYTVGEAEEIIDRFLKGCV